jgi:hypothetical protein
VAVLLGVAAFATVPDRLPVLGPPCQVALPDGQLDLSREDARAVTALGATAVRDGVPSEQLVAEVAAVLAGTDQPAGEPTDETADEAAAVAAAARGSAQGALSCRTIRAERLDEPEGPGGLTPRAERLRVELEAAFGPQALGGFAPGGVDSGHIEGSAHYEGRAIDVFYRPVTPEGTERGWALAHWAVAHADELDVATVIFDRQIWSVRRAADGWRPYRHPSGDLDNPVLAHEDHVHLDVAR